MPTRKTVNTTGLSGLLKTVNEKMGIDLKSMPYVNVPVDGWSENIYKNIKLIVLFLKFKFLVRLKLCIK